MEDLLGYLPIVAAVFGIPQYLPQINKLRSTGDTVGVSWSWAALTGVNNSAWLGYFIASGYWTAVLPSSAAATLAGVLAVLLAVRGRASWQATTLIGAWAALLITGYVVAGRVGLGTLLTGAFVMQVVPSLWTAYRTKNPTGVAAGTWLLILGELACWLAFGLYRSDQRLIVLGLTGVTASAAMLARIRAPAASRLAWVRRGRRPVLHWRGAAERDQREQRNQQHRQQPGADHRGDGDHADQAQHQPDLGGYTAVTRR